MQKMEIGKIDLHMHSIVSDGTDTPSELLKHVRDAGITLFSLTDHDAVNGCAMIREILSENDPKLLNGTEFSCMENIISSATTMTRTVNQSKTWLKQDTGTG